MSPERNATRRMKDTGPRDRSRSHRAKAETLARKAERRRKAASR